MIENEIKDWLNSERDYETGVSLYVKYGKNPQLKKLFPNRLRYTDKLAYELGKLVGIGIADLAKLEKTLPKAPIITNQDDQGEQNSSGKSGTQSQDGDKQKTKDLHPKTEAYPPIIQRVISEISTRIKDRAVLKKAQNATPDENTDENVEQRRKFIELINQLSLRIEILYRAKNHYHQTLELPNEEDLWPDPDTAPEPETIESLTKKRNNLRCGITRRKNELEYQDSKKAEKPNPMPPCPKRTKLESEITAKEKEIDELNKLIEDATKPAGDSIESTTE